MTSLRVPRAARFSKLHLEKQTKPLNIQRLTTAPAEFGARSIRGTAGFTNDFNGARRPPLERGRANGNATLAAEANARGVLSMTTWARHSRSDAAW